MTVEVASQGLAVTAFDCVDVDPRLVVVAEPACLVARTCLEVVREVVAAVEAERVALMVAESVYTQLVEVVERADSVNASLLRLLLSSSSFCLEPPFLLY